MRKRAGLARALALDPELLFLDEPTSGLDPIAAADFDRLLADLRSSLGLTVFMVTHDLDSIYTIADRVAVLVDRGAEDRHDRRDAARRQSLDRALFRRAARPRRRSAQRGRRRRKRLKAWKRAPATSRSASSSSPCSPGWSSAALWFAGGQFADHTTRYETYFVSVGSGLTAGSPVRVNGVQLGRVAEVALDPNNPTRVRVTMDIAIGCARSARIPWPRSRSRASPARPRSRSAPAPRRRRRSSCSRGHRYPVIWSRELNLNQIVDAVPHLVLKLTDLIDQSAGRREREESPGDDRYARQPLAAHRGRRGASRRSRAAARRQRRGRARSEQGRSPISTT